MNHLCVVCENIYIFRSVLARKEIFLWVTRTGNFSFSVMVEWSLFVAIHKIYNIRKCNIRPEGYYTAQIEYRAWFLVPVDELNPEVPNARNNNLRCCLPLTTTCTFRCMNTEGYLWTQETGYWITSWIRN